MRKASLIFLLACLLNIQNAQAEYRAYMLDIYDHIQKKKWVEITGFSPDKYIQTHGGGNRLSAFLKATWKCYGDTSRFIPACPMPKAIKPLFNEGDRVKINLEKHLTQGWVGVVELVYYQTGVKSNVYGVKFGQKRQLYQRYFEFNLEKAKEIVVKKSTQED